MHAIEPATLALTAEGIPYSETFDDVYHSQSGGLAQARNVFLAGNHLPGRWQSRPCFVIAETGFGLGLSFLATWAARRRDPHRCARLHFISCELHPFSAADLATLHRQLFTAEPDLQALSATLLAQWPLLIGGMHRMAFDGGQVVLTLLFGDATKMLSQLQAQVDAFYLDGFAPAKNPALWQVPLFKQLSRLAATDATLATYTVAGDVRRGLEATGFAVARRPGFGGKRQMLTGVFRGRRTSHALPTDKRAIVIGAGLAGSAITERLAARGWHVTLLEQRDAPAQAASGNHAGAYRPVVSVDDNLQARLCRAAFLFGLRRLATLPQVRWQRCGALQLARTPDEAARFQRLAAQRGWPADYLQHVDAARASHLAGAKVAGEGLFFPQAGWINPPSLVQAQLDQAADHLTARFGVHVDALVYENGLWIAQDGNGKQIGAAPVVVLANAADAKRLAPTLQLASDERVVTTLPASTALSVNMVVCCGGYLTPVHDGLACIGSSPVGDDASRANLALLDQMLPDASAAMKHASLGSRQCARPGTPDRLPIVGPIADVARWQAKHAGSLHLAPRQSGLFALTGFGARGLVWQGLMAELLASQICGEPLPVERDLVLAVDPARFLARAGQRYDAASQAQDASD